MDLLPTIEQYLSFPHIIINSQVGGKIVNSSLCLPAPSSWSVNDKSQTSLPGAVPQPLIVSFHWFFPSPSFTFFFVKLCCCALYYLWYEISHYPTTASWVVVLHCTRLWQFYLDVNEVRMIMVMWKREIKLWNIWFTF